MNVDTSKWMEEIWSTIKNRSIWNILLPGTHNSGVFSAWNTIGVRNQDEDIGEQLEGGIRFLDIRVGKWGEKYLMHHSGHHVKSQRWDGEDGALKQLKDFVQTHRHEIVVFKLARGYGSNLEDDEFDDVCKDVQTTLKGFLIPPISGRDDTRSIMEMQQQGNVIVAVSKEEKKKIPHNFWEFEKYFQNTWRNKQSDGGITPEAKIAWLKPHIEQALRNGSKYFLMADCLIWTINVRHAAEHLINPKLLDWLNEWEQKPDLAPHMNVFMVDFYNHPDPPGEFVQTIIKMNRRRRAP